MDSADKTAKPPKVPDRQERLAERLRENLRKRKEQARAREQKDGDGKGN